MNAILIDHETLGGMSETTRSEIFEVIFAKSGGQQRVPSAPELSLEGPFDLTPKLTKKFMSGVGMKIKVGLRVFAEQGGRAKMSEVVAALEVENWQKLVGFQSGIVRRIRNITGDREAYLLEWEEGSEVYQEGGEEIIDGVWYISRASVAALQAYYGISN